MTDCLKYIVHNKYILFADITKEQKTLIMKSMLRDKIIKYIYFIADNNPRATEKIKDAAIGINDIKNQFFEIPVEIENIPYNWEYWQKLSEDAAIKIDQLNQQEKKRQEQLELKNNQTTMDMYDYFNEFLNQNGINASPLCYLIQRQGTIPRLAIHIEDWCKILEATGGDELVIKKLHELMIESNKTISDIAKARTFSKRNSKVAQNPRHNKKLDFVDMYEAQYRDEIQKSISKNIDKTDLDKKIYKMAGQMASKIQEVKIKNIKEWIKEYEAEYLFKVNSSKNNQEKQLITDIINRYGLLSHKARDLREKKIQNWLESYSC